jgi:hypothetical protein
MRQLDTQVKDLIKNCKSIHKYHAANDVNDGPDSDSSNDTISSADDRDLELILNGDH